MLKQRVQVIQNEAARAILNKKPRTSAQPLLKELGWMNLEKKRSLHSEVLFHKIVNGVAPITLREKLRNFEPSDNADLRARRNTFFIPSYRTNNMAKSFFVTTIKGWNRIPPDVRNTNQSTNFKARLNTLYVRQSRCHVEQ